jgi:hypothetical protein
LVQGNHDVANPKVDTLANSDGSLCSVHLKAVDTPLGRIVGVHGIIDERDRNPGKHKWSAAEYRAFLAQVGDILRSSTQ